MLFTTNVRAQDTRFYIDQIVMISARDHDK